MSIPGSAEPLLLAQQDTGYQIQRSVRFNSSDSAYLSRTPASAGNRKTWTWAGWVKRAGLGTFQTLFHAGPDGDNASQLRFDATTDVLRFAHESAGVGTGVLVTSQVFRDVSAWCHIVFACDTTQATDTNRLKLYVNGVQVTAFSSTVYPALNADLSFNTATPHRMGGSILSTNYLSGYLADIYFIDGQALTPSSFTEVSATTGQLIPKAYSGSFGTNGFWLKFSDNSAATATTLGKDYSGNSNNWTPNNLSVTAGAGNDSLVDTPTSYGTDTGAGGEVRGNYATWNPLRNDQGATLSNGNLDLSTAGSTSRTGTYATIGVTTGKWYWEITAGSLSTDGYNVGIASSIKGLTDPLGSTAESYIYINGGTKRNNNTTTSYGATYNAGDVIGVALDLDAGSLVFYKNGSSQGTAFTGIPTRDWFPTVADNATSSTSGASFIANFGQRPFAYTAPSGFKALCDTNLPAPVVAKPSTVMDVALWTGNGGTQTVSYANSSFSPDFIWFKSRSIAMNNHVVDVVRGTDANGYLVMQTDATFGESVFDTSWHNTYGKLTSISNNSFTVVSGTSNGGFNTNNVTYAGWAWDAGTTTTTNTAGSITSSVRANTSAGFSVVTYTGSGSAATVGHGLGVAPSMIIVKSRTNTWNWVVYHASVGNASVLALNTTAAAATYAAFANTTPTSTVFSLTGGADRNGVNVSAETHVAYCFAPVAGYSSMGSYVGNGSSDGPFVYTGFRPRWIMIKQTSASGENWEICDSLRNGYNFDNMNLYANLSASEAGSGGTNTRYDILSNGFKIRSSNPGVNANGASYIYCAFAESPLQYARAR